jgi:hypothetical protein
LVIADTFASNFSPNDVVSLPPLAWHCWQGSFVCCDYPKVAAAFWRETISIVAATTPRSSPQERLKNHVHGNCHHHKRAAFSQSSLR